MDTRASPHVEGACAKETHAARIAKTLKRSEGATRKKHLVWVYRWIRGFEFAVCGKISRNESRQQRGFFGFLGEGKWRTPLAIRGRVGMALRQGHEAEFVASAIRLLRIDSTFFLLINRAYRLVHGPLPQSQAFAILFLTSDTAPRLKLPLSLFHQCCA